MTTSPSESKPYTPQDNTCDFCGNRIGDHDKGQLWRCLDKIGESFNRARKAMRAFERSLEKDT